MPSRFQGISCACTSLRRASRAVCRLYDLVLAPTGLKVTQFIILRAIAESGEIAQCDLASSLAASVETLSRRLASLRAAGFVRMRVGARQKRLYSLTDKARQSLDAATPNWGKAQILFRRALGEDDWQLLTDFAERMTAAAIRAETLPLSRHARNVLSIGEQPGPARASEQKIAKLHH